MGDFKMGSKTVMSQSGTSNPTWGANAPTGTVISHNAQFENAGDTTEYSSDTTVSASQFSPSITSGNDIIFWLSFVYQKRSGGTGGHANMYFQGGDLGTGTSGKQIVEAAGIYAEENVRLGYTATIIDTNPGSSPTYSLYYDHESGSARIVSIYLVWGELKS